VPETIDIRELPARLDELLALAATGREIILSDGVQLRARLLPIVPSAPRIAGLHAGAVVPATDFDAPLPDDFWAGRT
jgi:antitoxin (DNA-binding transcriptional repressor) of toxin-antitoxin stability system